ncbi:Histone transcription regulator 3 [Coemansia sp. RSA 2704]|nr:Histone transcription regulator 3 [Coemansia sp. RSA 2704]
MADSGPETTAKHEIGVPLKRASSFSEDELPMKRRSARFSERTSTGVLSGTLAGAAGGVQAISSARPANARGTGRQPLSTLPEATSSEAFEQASECASTWFGLANANDEMSFADMLERYLALTGMYTGRSSSRQRSNLESDVRSEWNLPTDTRNGRVQSASALEDILSSMTGIAGEYAPALATSVAKQTSNETASNLAPGSESHYSIKVEGCVRLFADNRGASLLLETRDSTNRVWDKQVAQSLEGMAAGLSGVRLAAQLLAMLLALAKHFAIDPAPDSPANSMEAMFVGLAAWLVAALGSSTDVDTPASAGNCSQAQSSCSEDAEPLEPYVQLLDSIHRLLGERGLCTAADGAFLKHMLYACRTRAGEDAKLPARWNVIGSILRCLFDIKLHGCGAPHHPSAHIEMDSASANLTYLLVETELLDTLRNRKDASMRSDLKAIVDKTSGALADIDAAQHPRVAMNMDVIDDYLDGTAMPTFAQIDQALRSESAPVLVACVPPVEPSASMPAACVTLPFVRATTQHDTLRFRMRAGMARAVEDYDDILEDYKLHVSLHPASAEAWLHLGQAHSDLADELLLGTAAEILECKHDIAVLQRAALACLVQAKQLLEPLATDLSSTRSSNVEDHEQQHRLHIRVYSLAGRLIYRIAARPLPLLALQVLPSNILVANDDNSHQEWDLGRWRDTSAHALSRTLSRRYTALPPRRHIYELARVMLYRASRLDPGNWKWPYLVGKTAAKLLEPLTACALYLKASHLAAAEDSSSDLSGTTPAAGGPISEVAIDSMYKLLSALTKLLSSHQIDAVTAQRFVDALPYSQLASFYKTDFEAPGKHYVYLEKYLRLYIETLTATHDIDGLQLLVRKLRRSAGSLYDPPALLQETIRAETEALLGMVCALNCPKFVVDAGGREHIVLQSDLVGADVVQTHAVFRHCRLNRTQFNYARDYARESIASFAALHQRVATVLGSEKTPELAVAHDALAQMQPAVECYLETANKAITLFGHLMEQRKLTDDAATLSRLNDGLADLYVMVLSVYGQSKCSAPLPAHHGSMDALVAACREATDLLAHTPHLTRSESSFWRCIIFDDNRHESPQQYKLLDPLLEFQINKLIDAVRDARLQPPMASPEAPQGNIAAQTLAHLPPAPDAVPSTVSDAVPDAVPDVAMQ